VDTRNSSGSHRATGSRLRRRFRHDYFLSESWFVVTGIGNGANNIPAVKTNLPRQWSKKSQKHNAMI